MLELKNIVKNYSLAGKEIPALKGVSLAFRASEFVSVLGPSGCGKTTLLNIIGGLDRYTSGDLVINGVSTKQYRDRDWDTYRNHSVGFVFQSYNLIPHQSVLANVELALTLSGVSREERRRRAREVLEKVGLGDQLHKKPNQMSGGQMQRVAIARALVNDPDILLADEPTGALDTVTSVQIMELLKEISKEKLIIMVTHNPELAQTYSTRIIRLLDGTVTGDTAPYMAEPSRKIQKSKGKRSMSFFTALSLSFQNLLTKKTRTLMTSFAGSIGIIGIALILALSTGVQNYIDAIQRDTLTSYPITITAEQSDLMSMFLSMAAVEDSADDHGRDAVYSNRTMYDLFNAAFAAEQKSNNLTAFKEYLDRVMVDESAGLASYVSALQYQYRVPMNTYVSVDGAYRSTDLSGAFSAFGQNQTSPEENPMYSMLSAQMSTLNLWQEMLPGKNGALISEGITEQYTLLSGRWPQAAEEVILILDKNNEVSDIAFYALGLVTEDEVQSILNAVLNGTEIDTPRRELDYDTATQITFKLLLNTDYYQDLNKDGVWEDIRDNEALMEMVIKNAMELRIVGVVRPNPDAMAASLTGTFGYTSALTEKLLSRTAESPLLQAQLSPENQNRDLLTGLPFTLTEEIDPSDAVKAQAIREHFAALSEAEKAEQYLTILATPSVEELETALIPYLEAFPDRDSVVTLIADTYGLDREMAASYLSSYTDEDLNVLLREQFTAVIKEQYRATAEETVRQIRASHSEEELALLVEQIVAKLSTVQHKVAYVSAAWSKSTTMTPEAISAYLLGLTSDELDAAVQTCAQADAVRIYGENAGLWGNGDAKVAAQLDLLVAQADEITLAGWYDAYMPSTVSKSTLREVLEKLGHADPAKPSSISFYANTFEDKNAIADAIAAYNWTVAEEDQITYTDYVALMMSGVTTMINAVSYGLIAFVAISLVVSSIMIGIITYISVLERTKEIGVLRAIGASKQDISRVFNAETLLVGFTAGTIGIGISLLLCIPLNLIIHTLSGITAINATLPVIACVVLVLISMGLTLVAGLIPSGIAARKDPVEALRNE